MKVASVSYELIEFLRDCAIYRAKSIVDEATK